MHYLRAMDLYICYLLNIIHIFGVEFLKCRGGLIHPFSASRADLKEIRAGKVKIY